MTDQPMSEARLEAVTLLLDPRRNTSAGAVYDAAVDLLADRNELRRLATRHEDLRRQAEAVCERRTAEREDARHGMMVARAERDAAQIEVKRQRAKIAELLGSMSDAQKDGIAAALDDLDDIDFDSGPIPPPAPGECVECRASPGHWHHPDCSLSEGEPVPGDAEPAESLPIKLPVRAEAEPRKMPDPLNMHGACDEFGGSDY